MSPTSENLSGNVAGEAGCDSNIAPQTSGTQSVASGRRGAVRSLKKILSVCLAIAVLVPLLARAAQIGRIELDQEKDKTAALARHVGKTVRVVFTVRKTGGEGNIYIDSSQDENAADNLIVFIPEQGVTSDGQNTWEAFKKQFGRSHNVQSKPQFRQLVEQRKIEVVGKLIRLERAASQAPRGSESNGDSNLPFRITITDPTALKLLPKN